MSVHAAGKRAFTTAETPEWRIVLTPTPTPICGIATTISEQQSLTHTVTLRNDGAQAYRLYARWFVRHEITVQRLELPEGPAWQGTGQDWQDVLNGTAGSYRRSVLCKASFMSPQTAVLTFCEVGK